MVKENSVVLRNVTHPPPAGIVPGRQVLEGGGLQVREGERGEPKIINEIILWYNIRWVYSTWSEGSGERNSWQSWCIISVVRERSWSSWKYNGWTPEKKWRKVEFFWMKDYKKRSPELPAKALQPYWAALRPEEWEVLWLFLTVVEFSFQSDVELVWSTSPWWTGACTSWRPPCHRSEGNCSPWWTLPVAWEG